MLKPHRDKVCFIALFWGWSKFKTSRIGCSFWKDKLKIKNLNAFKLIYSQLFWKNV